MIANLPTCQLALCKFASFQLANLPLANLTTTQHLRMTRNRLLPTHIFLILMMGIAVFMLVLAWIVQYSIASDMAYDPEPDTDLIWVRNGFLLAGTLVVVFSVGLLMQQKWAIQGFISLFWLGGIAWLGVVWYISRQLYSDPVSWWIAIGGISILIFAFLAVGILFLSYMMRNRLTPIQLFSILMMGISLSLLVFALFFQQESTRNVLYPGADAVNRETIMMRNFCIVLSLIVLVPALALLTRQKWALVAFTVLFWLVGITWTGLFVLIISTNSERFDITHIALLAGFSVLVFSCTIAGVLFLDNAWVLESFTGNAAEKEGLPDVLDQ